jgi:hypothetical protein
MTEPIRQAYGDGKREAVVARWVESNFNWQCYATPKYYFVDFLVNQKKDNGYANFIGSLEVKWLNRPMNAEVKFPFQKLQKMWLTEPIDDDPQAFNRILIRYTDGILLAPAGAFRAAKPVWGLTRADTNEFDFNINFIASVHLPEYIIHEVIND